MLDPATTSRRWEAGVALALLCGAVALFLAVPTLVSGWAFTMPGTTDNALQPSFFPRAVLVLLGLAAAAVLATGRIRKDSIPLVSTPRDEWLQLLRVLATVIAYFACIRLIGFQLASMLYVPATALAVGFRRPLLVAAVALGFPVCTWAVFRYGLGVMLPSGPFG
ncbi:tripartite tricarboxylate transporter TctB family protein [Aureimonas altamirensis]|uniref:tripartite tricarboxylate transporter TctB family protein n=1 Tax=Aureimonas altamirensis TaxID=370622 RepID=UPI00301A9A42